MSDINRLSPEAERNRILDSAQAASFSGISLPHWRRMYRSGLAPKPILIGERKYGWRIGDLIDWLAAKADQRNAA